MSFLDKNYHQISQYKQTIYAITQLHLPTWVNEETFLETKRTSFHFFIVNILPIPISKSERGIKSIRRPRPSTCLQHARASDGNKTNQAAVFHSHRYRTKRCCVSYSVFCTLTWNIWQITMLRLQELVPTSKQCLVPRIWHLWYRCKQWFLKMGTEKCFYSVFLCVIIVWCFQCLDCVSSQKDDAESVCNLRGCNCTNAAPSWKNVNCTFDNTQASSHTIKTTNC